MDLFLLQGLVASYQFRWFGDNVWGWVACTACASITIGYAYVWGLVVDGNILVLLEKWVVVHCYLLFGTWLAVSR